MPIFLTTDQINEGVVLSLGATANRLAMISEGTTAVSNSFSVILGGGNGQQAVVAGTAYARLFSAIDMAGDDSRVEVLASGQVSTGFNEFLSSRGAVALTGRDGLVTNFGTISGGEGLYLPSIEGGGHRVVNHGAIIGHGGMTPVPFLDPGLSGAGIHIDTGDVGRRVANAADSVIVNTGTITGGRLGSGALGYAVLQTAYEWMPELLDQVERDNANGAVSIFNAGLLMGHVRLLDRGNLIENSGTIHGDIDLGAGRDFLDTRLGHVTGVIRMGAGMDTVIGSADDDEIHGEAGDDRLFGLDGDDLLFGGAGEDRLFGGAGDDTIFGGTNGDAIHGGSGDDLLYGEGGADLIYGGPGNDSIYGGTAEDTIYGGSGDDEIYGGANADQIWGGSGNDLIYGGTGFDTVYGGAGNDTLYGGSADDLLDGGSGDDVIYGGTGNDTLRGSLGNDTLFGDEGDNLMFGGSGDDVIHAGTGLDIIYGGNGADVFVWTDPAQSAWNFRDVIMDFTPGEDRIDISAIHPSLTWSPGGFTGVAGQVYYATTTGRLWVDMNGTGGANFGINLTNAPALTEADLIL